MNDTLKFYNINALKYASDMGMPDENLNHFTKYLKSGAKVLELGTGSGADAEIMLANGFDVLPTDGSEELAAIATERLGRQVQIMQFNELEFDSAFDGVYACASLTHAERNLLPDIVIRINKALLGGGVVWASFKLGEAEGYDKFGRYYNYLTPEELISVWRRNGAWSEVNMNEWLGSGYDGVETKWAAITAFR
ncbi:class I SAM-dependent methyltransferase [Roseibium sediminis]|uniref:class I SAM-dependent methyltransferase n=1 Tax=Roseibium sediminis TaxID=1775174 RepID=UPI001FCAF09A|nr:class I SAM-dependent methyltransferase [Roseibium sediminis]